MIVAKLRYGYGMVSYELNPEDLTYCGFCELK